jgi:hypothetical protein
MTAIRRAARRLISERGRQRQHHDDTPIVDKYLKPEEGHNMNSMFDFITHVKGIEYILSLTFIAGYVLFWEVLKPKPFRKIRETGKEDLEYVKQNGMKNTLKLAGKIAAAPFIGLFYIILLPVGMVSALSYALVSGIAGKNTSFSWRPAEAYLSGKKKTRKHDVVDGKQAKQK